MITFNELYRVFYKETRNNQNVIIKSDYLPEHLANDIMSCLKSQNIDAWIEKETIQKQAEYLYYVIFKSIHKYTNIFSTKILGLYTSKSDASKCIYEDFQKFIADYNISVTNNDYKLHISEEGITIKIGNDIRYMWIVNPVKMNVVVDETKNS